MKMLKKLLICAGIFLCHNAKIESYDYDSSSSDYEQRISDLEDLTTSLSTDLANLKKAVDYLLKQPGTSLKSTTPLSTPKPAPIILTPQQKIDILHQQNSDLQNDITKRQSIMATSTLPHKIQVSHDAILTDQQQIAVNNQVITDLQSSVTDANSRSTDLGHMSSKKTNKKKMKLQKF